MGNSSDNQPSLFRRIQVPHYSFPRAASELEKERIDNMHRHLTLTRWPLAPGVYRTHRDDQTRQDNDKEEAVSDDSLSA